MRKESWRGWLILLVLLIVPGLARSQAVQQSRTLMVNGRSGPVKIMEIDGRSYVDLESLARIVNGTLGFSGNQITLTLPSSAAGTESAAAPSKLPANSAATSAIGICIGSPARAINPGPAPETEAILRPVRSEEVPDFDDTFELR